MNKFKKALQENVILVDFSWTKCSQGIVITAEIPVDFSQVINIVKLSEMFVQFVMNKLKDTLKKFGCYSKFQSPMLTGEENQLKMYMCFVGQDTEELKNALNNMKQMKQKDY